MDFFSRKFSAALAVALIAASSTASAVVLDWDTVIWTAGSTSNSYNIDPLSAGNDVTISLTGNNGATFAIDTTVTPNIQTPAVAKVFEGGLGTTENTLVLGLNLTNNTQSVTLTLDFSSQYSAGILNLVFRLFDVDYANVTGNTYRDMLSNIRGLSYDGVTWITPTITTSASNTVDPVTRIVTGTASVTDTGPTSGNGNVTLSFGANAITKFEFTYGSGVDFANPTFQHVGFYDFSFTPVPEINPVWSAVVSCIAALGLVLRHRANFRK